LLLLLIGLFANQTAPYPPNAPHVVDALNAPSSKYLLGTDNLGRDLLSRIIFGARISVVVGLVGALISVALSTTLGTLCGYFGGKFDLFVQRFVDAWMCFPGMVIILVVMSILGQGMWQVILVLGIQTGIFRFQSCKKRGYKALKVTYICKLRRLLAAQLPKY